MSKSWGWFEPAKDYHHVDRLLHLPSDDGLLNLANRINNSKSHYATTRVLIDDYRFIALFGDRHFARTFRLPMNTTVTRRGDSRKPFRLNDGTVVDVMTRRAPKNALYPDLTLSVKAHKGPDVVILIAYAGVESEPQFVGWMEEKMIRTYPVITFRDDVENFVVPHDALHPLWTLMSRHQPRSPLARPPVGPADHRSDTKKREDPTPPEPEAPQAPQPLQPKLL